MPTDKPLAEYEASLRRLIDDALNHNFTRSPIDQATLVILLESELSRVLREAEEAGHG